MQVAETNTTVCEYGFFFQQHKVLQVWSPFIWQSQRLLIATVSNHTLQIQSLAPFFHYQPFFPFHTPSIVQITNHQSQILSFNFYQSRQKGHKVVLDGYEFYNLCMAQKG